MDFPPIMGLDVADLPRGAAREPASPVILAGTAPGDAERMDMWQYFVEHIDEFEVAKAIVDHFDAHPKDLHSDKVDVDSFALYLRAKITLKRQAVAFATAQAALAKAREQSRGLGRWPAPSANASVTCAALSKPSRKCWRSWRWASSSSCCADLFDTGAA
jgi:hypothetical protein